MGILVLSLVYVFGLGVGVIVAILKLVRDDPGRETSTRCCEPLSAFYFFPPVRPLHGERASCRREGTPPCPPLAKLIRWRTVEPVPSGAY